MLRDLTTNELAQMTEYMNKVNSGREEEDDDDMSMEEFSERMDREWQ